MKRLAWSLVGCFGIPALYTLALALFFLWTKNVRLVLRLRFPVAWPRYVLVHLVPSGSFPLRPGDRLFLIPLVFIDSHLPSLVENFNTKPKDCSL